MAREGQIKVQSEKIFPIIKKWLYSDKDIFLRELISNASDAIKKLERLNAIGSFNFDLAPVIIVAFFTALLVMGTKIGARVDGALTILKIAIVVFIVVVGFFYIKAENFTPFIPPSEPAASTDGSGVSALIQTAGFRFRFLAR